MAGGSVVRQKKGDYYKEEVKNVMCKIGDIILIERYKARGKTLDRQYPTGYLRISVGIYRHIRF